MSTPLSSGERLHNLLGNLRTKNGNVLQRDQWIKAATDFIDLEIQTTRKTPRAKGTPAPKRPRNPLFDCLATVTGTRNVHEMSRAGLRAVGVALADIQAVTPDLTEDEIKRRAAAFTRAHPTWNLTAPTLAKYWGNFSPRKETTRSGESDPYQEPDLETWHAAADVLYPGTLVTKRPWLDVPIDLRMNILKQITRTRNTAPTATPITDARNA